jgi:hypothetical protein
VDLEIHYSGEWAALYINGELDQDTVGDAYHAEEKAFDLVGVKQVHDGAFMRGQSQRSGVAQTLAEVAEFRVARDGRLNEAARKRAEAERLLAEAKELES